MKGQTLSGEPPGLRLEPDTLRRKARSVWSAERNPADARGSLGEQFGGFSSLTRLVRGSIDNKSLDWVSARNMKPCRLGD